MEVLRRLGLSIGVVFLAVFVIIVTIIGYFKWLFTGESLNEFAGKVVEQITKKHKK